MVPAASCFTATGDLDRAAFQSNIDAYVGHGVDGVLVAGSSGESALLDDHDRGTLLTWARERMRDEMWLLAGVRARDRPFREPTTPRPPGPRRRW